MISRRAGGAERDRTVDLLNAIETRSQLRYGPMICLIDVTARAYASGVTVTSGGGEGSRTPGLVLAKDALSQLSYTPGG